MVLFFLVTLAIGLQAVLGPLAGEPWWFRGFMLASLSLQAQVGGLAAKAVFRRKYVQVA